MEGFNGETAAGEPFRGARDLGVRFRRGASESGALQDSHSQTTQLFLAIRAQGYWCGKRVARVWASHDLEEHTNIGDGAGHGADDTDPTESASTRREMSRGGDAAGRRLETTNAGKMRGHANGTTAVAADAARGASCGDGG